MRALLADLAGAVGLLTRMPIGRFGRAVPAGAARGVWAYPIVGGIVGAIGGAVYWLLRGAGMPPALAAIWTLAAMVAATGGLHEDGLADTADGFGGGATQARKLEIMRDSRIGTFGVLALVFSLAVRATAIGAIADRAHVAAALIVAGALGRGAIVGVVWLLSPARADGLGAALGRPPAASVATGGAIAAVIALALLPLPMAGAAILLAVITCIALAAWAQAQIGGHTGDVFGAVEQLTECVVLAVLATIWV